MRLPTVAIIGQRGGPSTGTVIYSQQEVNLTCFGGNGEGLRIVYSVSSPQELFDYTLKSFNTAWKYHFPTFVLSDGYNNKTLTDVTTYSAAEKQIDLVESKAYLLGNKNNETKSVNLRNTYNLEKELNAKILKNKKEYDEIRAEIVEYEDLQTLDADIVIFAHGIVSASAKQAIEILGNEGKKVGMFRPITLRPFPTENARSVVKNKKMILVIESSLGQLEHMVKSNLYGESVEIKSLLAPAMGIEPEEIVTKVNDLLKERNE
jgi:2-oxoglutarate ferredoxin oxidoreductase subunit alpha